MLFGNLFSGSCYRLLSDFVDLDFTDQNIICGWNEVDYGNKSRIEREIRINYIYYGLFGAGNCIWILSSGIA